jgi:hypothetical protein
MIEKPLLEPTNPRTCLLARSTQGSYLHTRGFCSLPLDSSHRTPFFPSFTITAQSHAHRPLGSLYFRSVSRQNTPGGASHQGKGLRLHCLCPRSKSPTPIADSALGPWLLVGKGIAKEFWFRKKDEKTPMVSLGGKRCTMTPLCLEHALKSGYRGAVFHVQLD